jgi:acyl carrier protein
MSGAALRAVVLEALGRVAPEADLGALDPAADLRDQLEIDSMDLLNFVIALHELTGVEIPEVDYPKLVTLDSATRYLAGRGARPARS